jgi:hypothetical protein
VNVFQPLAIGAVLALGVSAYASWIGLDRDRAFYPTVLIVIAACYVLFSVMGGITRSTILEISIASIFTAAAFLAITLLRAPSPPKVRAGNRSSG